MGWTGIAMQGVSSVVSIYGQEQQSRTQTSMEKYNAKIAYRNAKIAKQNAEYEAKQKRKETTRLIGKQRALYGKAGVTMEGSPLEVIQETAAQGEMDALMIERKYAQEAATYKSQALLHRMRAKAYGQQGGMKAFGSFLLQYTKRASYGGK